MRIITYSCINIRWWIIFLGKQWLILTRQRWRSKKTRKNKLTTKSRLIKHRRNTHNLWEFSNRIIIFFWKDKKYRKNISSTKWDIKSEFSHIFKKWNLRHKIRYESYTYTKWDKSILFWRPYKRCIGKCVQKRWLNK